MKTFQEFYEYTRTLTPWYNVNTPHGANKIPNTTIGLIVYNLQTDIDIINMESGNGIANVFFRPDQDAADIYRIVNGKVDYTVNVTVPMSVDANTVKADIENRFGRYVAVAVVGTIEILNKLGVKLKEVPEKSIDHFYILTNPQVISLKSGLGGKLLRIKRDRSDGRFTFFDAYSSESLWRTTPAEYEEKTYGHISFLTIKTQNSVYELIKVDRSLIQSMDEIVNPKKLHMATMYGVSDHEPAEESAIVPLEVVSTKHDHKDIHYGDGFMSTDYTFNRSVTAEEFRNFCKEKGLELREKKDAAWYEDYGVITKIDDHTWQHKRVMRYTD